MVKSKASKGSGKTGRPKGSKNSRRALPPGGKSALQVFKAAATELEKRARRSDALARSRIGEQKISDPAYDALVRTMERVSDVLEERVDYRQANAVMKAVSFTADAIAGPQAQKHEMTISLETLVLDSMKEDDEA